MKKLIRILIVDDSTVFQDLLRYIFSSEDDMLVVGVASDGKEAINLIASKKPDLITMDLYMPVMNGLEAIRKIMEDNPIPIVVISSSYQATDGSKSFQAIDAGALTILPKPVGINHPNFARIKAELVKTIRAMAEIKVVTKRQKYLVKQPIQSEIIPPATYNESKTQYKIAVIGVSTGGPQVLSRILPQIPKDISFPIVIAQHISDGFLEGMVEWLSRTTELKIEIAEHNKVLEKGTIYFCPTERNTSIQPNLVVNISKDISAQLATPSISHLFRSIHKNFRQNAIGILMTGMGRDGVEELAIMKETGAVTIVQDKDSCIVYGIPYEAVRLNAQKYILSPENIVKKIVELSQNMQNN
jgi:two-component system, chemotaxis family, protein-glutamate methylesterase/glutaminase